MKATKQRPRAKKLLSNSAPHSAETPLHIAALTGDIEELNSLITSKEYDINATGDRQFTALHFAANAGVLEVCEFM